MDLLGLKIDVWLFIGLAGQGIFFSRWIIQWITSEVRKQISVPALFWYCSILGSLITLMYAIHQKDPVFIMSNSISFLIYVRNLILHFNGQAKHGDIAT